MIVFKNILDFIQQNTTVSFLTVEGNTYNLEVWFGLREPGWQNFIYVRGKWAFDIFLDFLKIRTQRNIVSCNDDTLVLNSNEIGYSARFNGFESLIDVDNMWTWILDEFLSGIIVYWNDNLFPWETLSGHGDPQFEFVVWAVDEFLNLLNLLIWKIWECLLNFQCFLDDVL